MLGDDSKHNLFRTAHFLEHVKEFAMLSFVYAVEVKTHKVMQTSKVLFAWLGGRKLALALNQEFQNLLMASSFMLRLEIVSLQQVEECLESHI